MTNLEEKIFQALLKYEGVERDGTPMTASICQGHAGIAAKIALELAEKAYEQGWDDGYGVPLGEGPGVTFKQFIEDYIGG